MKFPSPAAVAVAGTAQAQIETGASHHGIALAADLATQVNPPFTPFTPFAPITRPGSAPLQRLCFRSVPKASQLQLRGGDAVGSLN